jgi:hypothetical protein
MQRGCGHVEVMQEAGVGCVGVAEGVGTLAEGSFTALTLKLSMAMSFLNQTFFSAMMASIKRLCFPLQYHWPILPLLID